MVKIFRPDQLEIKFNFSRHKTIGDALLIESGLKTYRPHVYVPEAAARLDEKSRIANNKTANRIISEINKQPELARFIVKDDSSFAEYTNKETELLIKYGKAIVMYVESYTKEEKQQLEAIDYEITQASTDALETLTFKDIKSAGFCIETCHRLFLDHFVDFRNVRMVEGFIKLLEELPDYIKLKKADAKLRLFSSCGLMHFEIAESLSKVGFTVSHNVDVNNLPFYVRNILKLRDSGELDEYERTYQLFFDIVGTILDQQAENKYSYVDVCRLSEAVFVKIGQVEGFTNIVESVADAKNYTSLEEFRKLLGRKIEDTLVDRVINSRAAAQI
jgi:hypothetical protein